MRQSRSFGGFRIPTLLIVGLLAWSKSVTSSPVRRQESFFVDNFSLGTYYPYVVHLPSKNITNPPVVVMLGGTGSRGDPSQISQLATYNGIGRRLAEYANGNYTTSSILAAEEFLTVVPIAPIEETTEWHIDVIPDILYQVYGAYGYDTSRVFLLGFSMGGRDAWKIALQYPGLFTAMAVAAGEPDSTYGSLASLANLPIRHYQGSIDYVSIYQSSLDTQQQFDAFGGQKCELIVVPGIDHNNMADGPFYAPLFEWLLSIDNSTGGEPPVPTLTTGDAFGSVALPTGVSGSFSTGQVRSAVELLTSMIMSA